MHTSGFLAMSLVLAANGHAMKVVSKPVLPFTYQKALPAPTRPDNSDAHLEIQQCVAFWRPYKAARQKLFDAMAAAGFFRRAHSILLEVGNAGFGYYGYAVMVEGKLADWGEEPGGKAMGAIDATPIQQLASSITDSAVLNMRSAASSSVADGDCHFLTITLRSGEYKQVVVYGPPSPATFAGRTIEALLPFLHRVQLHLPEK